MTASAQGRLLGHRTLRPFWVGLLIAAAVASLDGAQGRFATWGTVSSILGQFATVGPVALAVGLTMIMREFDLSVGGMTGLAGCIAVLTGGSQPLLGLLLAMLAGVVAGLVQGIIMTHLRLSSVAVTLGGLLTLSGIAYVITGDASISYPRLDVALLVNRPLLGVLTIRSLLALGLFAVAAIVMGATRIGRDLVAVGSDARAASVAGLPVRRLLVGAFAISGLLTSLNGALLSYSIASASPAALANTLVPAVAAAIIGGVSLSGGKGTPLGIAGGVLVLCVLRAGMSSIGLPPFIQDVATGGVLVAVAVMDAEDLRRRLHPLLRPRRGFTHPN